MSGYFSFERMVTNSIVKVIYFLGFLGLTTVGLAAIVWAGLRLHDANIARPLGWRYLAAGVVTVIFGNLLWRLLCELWIVPFQINSQLATLDVSRSVQIQTIPRNQIVERRKSRVIDESEDFENGETLKTQRTASVLGLT